MTVMVDTKIAPRLTNMACSKKPKAARDGGFLVFTGKDCNAASFRTLKATALSDGDEPMSSCRMFREVEYSAVKAGVGVEKSTAG